MYIGTYVCRGPNSALGVKSYHGATSCTDGLIAVRCVHSCVLINQWERGGLPTLTGYYELGARMLARLRARHCL